MFVALFVIVVGSLVLAHAVGYQIADHSPLTWKDTQ